MELREARVEDADAIATVAASSLDESYGHVVDADRIDALVDQWYGPDRMADLLSDDEVDWLVAEDDGEVVGFAQIGVLGTDPVVGEIHWLHVAPGARGEGIARQLLGQSQETLDDRGAAVLRGFVLAANETGTAFYEDHGFERAEDREVTVEDATYIELVYEKVLDGEAEPVVESVAGPDGDLVVNFGEGERGTDGLFYPVYRSRDRSDRYGWYCGNCESVDTAMDAMGRIECNDCGNRRKATRWDASYL